MLLIVLILLAVFLFVSIKYKISKKNVNILTVIISFLFVVVVSNRSDVIPDTLNYKDIYYYGISFIGYVEKFYIDICNIFNDFGVSFEAYLFFTNIFCAILWLLFASKISKNILFSLLMFMSYMGIYYWGIITRSNIAISLILLPLIDLITNRKALNYILYFIFVFIASNIHITVSIFYLIPFLCFKEYKTKYLVLFTTVFYILSILQLSLYSTERVLSLMSEYGFSRLLYYITRDGYESERMFSFLHLKYYLLCLYFAYEKNKIKSTSYTVFFNIYVLGNILYSMFSSVVAGSRLAILLLFFEFVLLSLINNQISNQSNNYRFLFYFMCFVLSILNFIFMYRLAPQILIGYGF